MTTSAQILCQWSPAWLCESVPLVLGLFFDSYFAPDQPHSPPLTKFFSVLLPSPLSFGECMLSVGKLALGIKKGQGQILLSASGGYSCKLCFKYSKTNHLSLCLSSCLVTQLCPTLCDPVDCSPPGSSVHGILQARILDWVAISLSRGSSQSRDWTCISWGSCVGWQILYHWATWDSLSNI